MRSIYTIIHHVCTCDFIDYSFPSFIMGIITIIVGIVVGVILYRKAERKAEERDKKYDAKITNKTTSIGIGDLPDTRN